MTSRKVRIRRLAVLVVVCCVVAGLATLWATRGAVPEVATDSDAGPPAGVSSLGNDSSGSGGGAGESDAPAESCQTVGEGGYPLPNLVGYANACNTGPRYECTSTQGSLTTSSDGQVIKGICINGSLDIRHDDITVRDVKIMGTSTYALDIGEDEATCPSNLKIEYTEVNMNNADNLDWGVYQRCKSTVGVHAFDHLKVHNAGRGMLVYGNVVVTNSYFYSSRTVEGAHRSALSTHGGDNFTVTGSTFICVNLHCSSSVNMYSDYAPVTNYLFEANVLAGGSICLRGGQTHNHPNDTHDIRVLNNRFSQLYYPECGSLRAFAQFDSSAPGNIRSGNRYHETGRPIENE